MYHKSIPEQRTHLPKPNLTPWSRQNSPIALMAFAAASHPPSRLYKAFQPCQESMLSHETGHCRKAARCNTDLTLMLSRDKSGAFSNSLSSVSNHSCSSPTPASTRVSYSRRRAATAASETSQSSCIYEDHQSLFLSLMGVIPAHPASFVKEWREKSVIGPHVGSL